MSSQTKRKPQKSDEFYDERTHWPFVHSVVPLALYIVTRSLILSLLGIYIYETIERLVTKLIIKMREGRKNSGNSGYFEERIDDSLIGDIIIGGLSIFTFWLFDQATGWNVVFEATFSPVYRAAAFVVIAALSLLIELPIFNTAILHIGTLFYALYYSAAAAIFFIIIPTPVPSAVNANVLVWLGVVLFYFLVAAPAWPKLSVYLRVLFAQLTVLLAAFITFVVIQRSG